MILEIVFISVKSLQKNIHPRRISFSFWLTKLAKRRFKGLRSCNSQTYVDPKDVKQVLMSPTPIGASTKRRNSILKRQGCHDPRFIYIHCHPLLFMGTDLFLQLGLNPKVQKDDFINPRIGIIYLRCYTVGVPVTRALCFVQAPFSAISCACHEAGPG